MIWNDPKYAPVIEALAPMVWDGLDRVEDECPPVKFTLKRQVNGKGWIRWQESVDGEFEDWWYVSDFEAGCILAEFADKWLAERRVCVVLDWLDGKYYVKRRVGDEAALLGINGRYHILGNMNMGMWQFTDRHEALAEGMLAFLREEGKL